MYNFSLTNIALELLQIDQDFRHRVKHPDKARIDDFELIDFDQTWGSTSLGFGGMGGSAMTTARTYVLIPIRGDENCLVYFAGNYAYSVPYSQKFVDDVNKHKVVGKGECYVKYPNQKKESL